jgi:hypothetical protein
LQNPSPIDETELFSIWQSKIPGVGNLYQVQAEMLHGLAVQLCSDSEKSWKFLPVDKMPLEASKCFEIMFKTKEFWHMDELEPYLEHMADATTSDGPQSPGNLLLRFTKIVQDDRHGISVKMYAKK